MEILVSILDAILDVILDVKMEAILDCTLNSDISLLVFTTFKPRSHRKASIFISGNAI